MNLRRASFDRSLCLQVDIDGASPVGAVQHAEAGRETVARGELIRQHGAQFSELAALELGVAQAQPVARRNGDRKYAPAGEIIGQFERHGRPPMLIGAHRGVPIGDVFTDAAHVETRAAVAAGVCAFLLEFLQSDEPGEQAVVHQVEIVELVQAAIGVEVFLAVLNEIEYGLIQNCDGKLDGLLRG